MGTRPRFFGRDRMGLFARPLAYTAGPSNAAALQEFFHVMARQPDGPEFLSDLSVLDSGDRKFIVVRERRGGPVAAYALLRQAGPDAEVEMLYALRRGKGYGQLALRTAEEVARTHGAPRVWLDAVPQAAAFYRHEGYTSLDGERFVKVLRA